MRQLVLFSALLLTSFSALAQEAPLPDSKKIIDDCNTTKQSNSDKIDCRYKASEMLKERVDALYAKRLSEAAKEDTQAKSANIAGYESIEFHVRKSQTDFETYLTSECARQSSYYYGSVSGGSGQNLNCEIRLRSARVYALSNCFQYAKNPECN